MHSTIKTLFDGVAADGVSEAQNVENARHLVLALATADSANLTIQFMGSISIEKPDFSAARSTDNQYEYLQVKDLQNGSGINGDDGISFAATDDHRLLEVNTNGIKWIAAKISSHSAGTVYLTLRAFED